MSKSGRKGSPKKTMEDDEDVAEQRAEEEKECSKEEVPVKKSRFVPAAKSENMSRLSWTPANFYTSGNIKVHARKNMSAEKIPTKIIYTRKAKKAVDAGCVFE